MRKIKKMLSLLLLLLVVTASSIRSAAPMSGNCQTLENGNDKHNIQY